MYIGNLEAYQGIDLMLDGFSKALTAGEKANLMVIGGEVSDINYYTKRCESLGISANVVFAGKMPLDTLFANMAQSDCLVSPRVHGINTPMKIYSYLDSGKPVLATKRLTHTQVMNDDISVLVEPNADEFARAMISIIQNPAEYAAKAIAAAAYIKREHSYEAFARQADSLYRSLENDAS
jgi:glycosyltransferase involved in cell wall biosynthesis